MKTRKEHRAQNSDMDENAIKTSAQNTTTHAADEPGEPQNQECRSLKPITSMVIMNAAKNSKEVPKTKRKTESLCLQEQN